MSSWSSVIGAIVGVVQRHRGRRVGPVLRSPSGQARTAVLLPVYEEDAVRVFAAASVMAESIGREKLGHVDVFVLSDTQSLVGARVEERIAARIAATRGSAHPAIFYRRRADNRGRKAGNIAEFCTRWGAAYDFMVVLDADSLMTGAAIARLVGAMEANPNAGLIQAMCYPVGRSTFFARVQQFSARLYGPLFQRGVAFWQGPRGNFWGHNAILRTRAFAGSCGLPLLPGRPPFGGEIMSHDTVEAALMLRGGWDVWMLPDGPQGRHGGSWEETPTNLLDHLNRDRRWCQGNLQHIAVLRARGLRLASRYHLGRGLLHYLYVVPFLLWLTLYALLDPQVTGAHRVALAWLVAVLLVFPRLLCLVETLADRDERRGFGGAAGLVASTILDQVLGWLIHPVALVFHIWFVAAAITGHAVHWNAQLRDDRALQWRETAKVMAGPLLAGLAATALLWLRAPGPAALLAPGLVLAIPIAVWFSRWDLGAWARRYNLFTTPEETRPPAPYGRLAAAVTRLTSQADAAPLPHLPPERGLSMPTQVLRTPRHRSPTQPAPARRSEPAPPRTGR